MNIRIRAGLSQTSTGKWSGDSTAEMVVDLTAGIAAEEIERNLTLAEGLVQASRNRMADDTAAEVARRNKGGE